MDTNKMEVIPWCSYARGLGVLAVIYLAVWLYSRLWLIYLFWSSFSATVGCGAGPKNVPICNPWPQSPCLSNTSGVMGAPLVGAVVVDGIASGELGNGVFSLSPVGPVARLTALPLRLVARDPYSSSLARPW